MARTAAPVKHLRRSSQIVPLGLLLSAATLVWTMLPNLQHHSIAAVREPKTGIEFPDELHKRDLAGVGVKRRFGVLKQYAIGMYIDQSNHLWGATAKPEQVLINAPGHASLRVVITSGFVSKESFAAALRESVEPRLTHVKENMQTKLAEELERVFINGPDLTRGTEIVLGLEQKSLKVQVDNQYKKTLRRPELMHAVLAAYFDKDAVIPAFKDAVLTGLKEKQGAL